MFQLNNSTKENTFLRFSGSMFNIYVVQTYSGEQFKGKFVEFSLQQCSSQPYGELIVAGDINSSEIILGRQVSRGGINILRTATTLRCAYVACL